mmetsp:Transcript_58260/g.142451  ORF Transcript_58260/g.142451 Transcript_58260/m.142451 type:complete len:188 (-) Transcript_58260:360-923(-)
MYRAYSTCCHTPIVLAFWNELNAMGVYSANLKMKKDKTKTKKKTTRKTTNKSKLNGNENENENADDRKEEWAWAVRLNPKTLVWDDDETTNLLPRPDYRQAGRYAINTTTDKTDTTTTTTGTTTTKDNEPKEFPRQPVPDGTNAGYPLRLVLRFMWRCLVVGPKVQPDVDFHIPDGHEPEMISVFMI